MKVTLKLTLAAVAIALTVGCANQESYKLYAESQAQVDQARYAAETAKYKAMSDIAASGDTSAKIAAVMAIALNGQSSFVAAPTKLVAPESNSATAFQWASVLVPSLTQIYGIRSNAAIAMNQSDNAARTVESTNNAFVGIAGKIQAPVANVSTTTTSTLSGTGTLGSGSYVTDTHAVDSHAATTTSTTTDNHTTSPTTVTPAAKVCTIDPLTSALTCQ